MRLGLLTVPVDRFAKRFPRTFRYLHAHLGVLDSHDEHRKNEENQSAELVQRNALWLGKHRAEG